MGLYQVVRLPGNALLIPLYLSLRFSCTRGLLFQEAFPAFLKHSLLSYCGSEHPSLLLGPFWEMDE